MAISVVLGLCLARYNVFAVLMALGILIMGCLIYGVVRSIPITHIFSASVAIIVFLPAGYLAGHLLRPSGK